jgi:uncharacterized membrane-anchored protein YitT (DUF2179 family)
VVFGWEAALAAIITLFLSGVASDYVLEGPSVVRTATIVTDQPEQLAHIIQQTLNRGTTKWSGEDGIKHHAHGVLFVTIARPEVRQLTEIVSATDPEAFITIGHGQVAFGRGFKSMQH